MIGNVTMKFRTGLTILGAGKLKPSTSIKLISTVGLEHIEFDKSVFIDLENVKNVLTVPQTAIHAPYIPDYTFDLSSPLNDADQFVTFIQKSKKDLNLIGVVVHPPEEINELFYDRLTQIPFPLLENLPYQSWENFMKFRDEVKDNATKNFGYCFDIPHSFITNGNEFLDVPSELLTALKKDSGYIHISGSDRLQDQHYPLVTDGDLPFNEVKTFLKEINFSGTINMELVPRSLDDIPKMFKSFSIMLNISGKRYKALKVRLKIPFIMYNIRDYKERINEELMSIKANYRT